MLTPVASALLEIQAPVRESLDRVPDEIWRIVQADVAIVEAANAHLRGMRGKLFRPTLLLLAAAVEGKPEERAIPLAAVTELVHLTSVVHDDSVDHSVLRRGQPTINALFSHQVAVLMGDFLFSKAIAELVRLGDLEPLRVFTQASNEMTLGELRQLASFDALTFSEKDYYALIRAKTASLLGAACEMGALAGAPRYRAPMRRFGERLGMAFQIADDLLDYTELETVTGKPSGNDLREHKVTLPLIAAMPSMSRAQRERVEALFDDPTPSDETIAEVVGIVTECGGLEMARQKGEAYAADAAEALAGIPGSEVRQALSDALGYVMDRRS
ncbi:MAG: polyprenyl synthetase family protein [Gemmatimonadales bacterium]|nr:polyprenyl synthetase family protein [Gemmatimonadota bacterium]MCL4214365.1 polyprenyl synthetase family protein [Gemmatimonadales bacterium]